MSVPGNLYTPTIRKTRGGDYLIEQSLLFNDGDSAYLSRTPSTAGNRKTWTFSCWVKRGSLGAYQYILSDSNSASTPDNYDLIAFDASDQLEILFVNFGISSPFQEGRLITSAKFSDPNAWYHIAFHCDTTAATANDRMRLWVNGVEITSFGTRINPTQNFDTNMNNVDLHAIGRPGWYDGVYFDGLMALPILVDGAALDPTSFGEEDDDGYWNPIEFTGAASTEDYLLNGITPIASGEDAGYLKAKAFDGNNISILSEWRSGVFGASNNGVAYIGFDAGAGNTVQPDTLYIMQGRKDVTGNGAVSSMLVQYSDDNSTWTTQSTEALDNSAANADNFEKITLTSAPAKRYWRCLANSTTTGSGQRWAVTELQMFAASASAGFGTNGGEYDFADTKSFGLDVSDPLVTFQDAYNISGLHFDGTDASTTFTDETGRTWTQGGSAAISTTQAKFGGSSLYLGDNTEKWYVTTADTTELDFAGDFTVESWVYFTEFGDDATTVQGAWFTKAGGSRTSLASASGSSAYCCGFNGSTQLAFYMNANTGAVFSFSALSLNTWYHVALTRNGNNWYLFIDGVQVGGTQSNSNVPTTNAEPFDIGRSATYSGGNWYYPGRHTFSGYIDDFQISNFAKYTAGFTPLTRAFYSNNTFGPSGFVTADQVADTPTDDADLGIGNFVTLNPNQSGSGIVLYEGNTKYIASTANRAILGTVGFSSGKYYWEVTVDTVTNLFGIDDGTQSLTEYPAQATGNNLGARCFYPDSGYKYNGAASSAVFGNSCIAGEIVGVAVDMDNGAIWISTQGVWQDTGGGEGSTSNADIAAYNATAVTNAMFTGLTSFGTIFPLFGPASSSQTLTINFGQTAFAYTPPTGFEALATQNLPAPTIADPSQYFNTVLYTGNGTSQSITGVGFQPDLVWMKSRDFSYSHTFVDVVRGATKEIYSNATNAETTAATGLTSLDSDGFSVGADAGWNANADDKVAWCWKAGGTAVTNSIFSITSQVSVNTTSGFSIVTYTAPASPSTVETVGHGLGAVPGMMIWKNRTDSVNWYVWHKDLAANNNLKLNSTAAQTNDGVIVGDPPASPSHFNTLGALHTANKDYVAYCWAEVEGFSAFGKYTGNGSADGPFVHCGFRPAYILTKRIDSGGEWYIVDNKRSPYNPTTSATLEADDASVEGAAGANSGKYDFLSNGFKVRATNGSDFNGSGATFIFAAYAETPFQGDDGVTQGRAK